MDISEMPYKSLTKESECWVIVARGALAFRFGPYKPTEAGAILTECIKRRIAANLVVNSGTEFDYELAADLGVRITEEAMKEFEDDKHDADRTVPGNAGEAGGRP